MKAYWILLFALSSMAQGYSQANLFNQVVSRESRQLGEINSIRFTVNKTTTATSNFEGIKADTSQKTTLSYWSQKGSRDDLTNLFKYKLKLVDPKVGVVVDEEVVYDQGTFAALDNRAGQLSVDIIVPGPYDLLRNSAGVFLPLRFLALLSNGRSFEPDGFMLSLDRLAAYNSPDFLKNSQVSALARDDKLVKRYWPEQTCFYVRNIPPLNKTQVVTSFYLVALSKETQMIIGWTYFENDSPKEALFIKKRIRVFNKKKEVVEVMSEAEMLHYVQGGLVSKSMLILSDISLDETYPEETFQLDPTMAKMIYDRQTKKLIRVPQ